jgi:hypothetical protein
MGLEALNIHGREIITKALSIFLWMETTTSIPKHSFLGSSAMNLSLNHQKRTWMVYKALTIIKY